LGKIVLEKGYQLSYRKAAESFHQSINTEKCARHIYLGKVTKHLGVDIFSSLIILFRNDKNALRISDDIVLTPEETAVSLDTDKDGK